MAHVLITEYSGSKIYARCECGKVAFISYDFSLLDFNSETKDMWYEGVIDMHRKHVRSINGLDTVLHDNYRMLNDFSKENN